VLLTYGGEADVFITAFGLKDLAMWRENVAFRLGRSIFCNCFVCPSDCWFCQTTKWVSITSGSGILEGVNCMPMV